jgi:uncharacterized membrane protein YciS (DUF1049 family)
MTEVEKNEIAKALQLNLGSRRREVAMYLSARAGKAIKMATIAKAVFEDAEAIGQISAIVKYLQWKIEVLKLTKKYKLTSERDVDGVRSVTFEMTE